MKRLALTVVLTVAVAGALGGCNSDKPTTGSTKDTTTSGVISPPDLPTPPAMTKSQGAVADTKVGSCATSAGRQTVTGTVTNSSKKSADFVITLNWTNAKSDVLGRGIAVVKDLAPGHKAGWKLTADVVKGATQCVPNVLRGRLAP